jgi:alkylation response protein AidB-like acyl-CoA dehydrogenase
VLRRDRLPTAEERIPWDWIQQADALGLRTLGIPKSYGGAGADILTMCIVGEELGVGDLGFAVILDQCWKFSHLFSEAMTLEQQQRFIPLFVGDPVAVTALGFTEPGVGSDHQGYYDVPEIDFQTIAVRDGDSFILNGTKRYVSNGCMAKIYFVAARLDPTKKLSESGAIFVVTSDMPGFRAGFFHEKSSQRLATNGTFHFEDCRVPAANLLVGKGMLAELRAKYMPGSKSEAAATVLGVGRAAYEYAFGYAKQRVQGGKPIVAPQALAPLLGLMAKQLAAPPQHIWRAAGLADGKDPQAPVAGLLAKVMASEVAFECCKLAGEILGGASIMYEHPVEKYLRDATSFMHSDGTNQMCLLRATRAIATGAVAKEYGF